MPDSRPRIMLLSGGPIHDWQTCAPVVEEILARRADVVHTHNVSDLFGLAGGEFDAVAIFYTRIELSDEQLAALKRFVEAGGGLLAIHGTTAFEGQEELAKLLGSRFSHHGPICRFPVSPCDPQHPVVTRTDTFDVLDELYILEPCSEFKTFATARWQGQDQPMGYEKTVGKGKVIYLANGHDLRSLNHPNLQRMIERSARVVCGETFETKVNVGILGYGGAFNMGRKHGEAANDQFGMKVTAVCDLDPKRTEAAKEELGQDIRTWTDPEAFLREGAIDLNIQILPHNLHAPCAIKALKAGKHVVTEKPFCLTLDEADQMIAAASDAGKMLSVYHNRRWDNDFLSILKQVRAGAIGNVFRVDAATARFRAPRLDWWRTQKKISGGAMYDWGAHYCDWMLNIMNRPIESVVGDFQKRKWHAVDVEDYTYALIRFADGTTATLEQGSLAAIPRNGWRILGTNGGIANDGPHKPYTLRAEDPMTGQMSETTVDAKGPDTAKSFYQNVANHLIMGEELVVKPTEARRAIGVIHLAEQSAKQGGKPLPLPGEEQYAEQCRYMTPWG